MKTQLISLDMHFLLKELKYLEGSRVDKIYSKGKEESYIQLFKSGSGKKVLRVIVGKAIFLTSEKDVDETPSGLCMALRKHLEGKFLDSIVQLEPERILKLVFKTKDGSWHSVKQVKIPAQRYFYGALEENTKNVLNIFAKEFREVLGGK